MDPGSLVVPVLGGALWDLTGVAASAFLPAAAMAVGMVAAPSWLRVSRAGSSRPA